MADLINNECLRKRIFHECFNNIIPSLSIKTNVKLHYILKHNGKLSIDKLSQIELLQIKNLTCEEIKRYSCIFDIDIGDDWLEDHDILLEKFKYLDTNLDQRTDHLAVGEDTMSWLLNGPLLMNLQNQSDLLVTASKSLLSHAMSFRSLYGKDRGLIIEGLTTLLQKEIDVVDGEILEAKNTLNKYESMNEFTEMLKYYNKLQKKIKETEDIINIIKIL